MPTVPRAFGMLAALALTLAAGTSGAQTAPAIAVAENVKFAIEELAAAFKRESGRDLRIATGSSGKFVQQIRQGAPFELFLSADEESVFRLADAGLTRDRGVVYAAGRLAIFAPHGSPLVPDAALAGLKSALAAGTIKRFAIANPEVAPYGQRAVEALTHAGLWPALKPHIVMGENIAQAAQFASSGSTEGGIIALSLALAPELARRGRYALIPAGWHKPLAQRMVLMKNAGAAAEAFYRYLQTPAAHAVFAQHGYTVPSPGG
ncbi:MAG TPA: molybdate ABC transporter substrate-binding protein [Alphaproteobacteria bacterium]|jgi:molybdate transport system substrate-binding protein